MAGIYKRGKTWWARAQRQGVEHRRSLKTTDKTKAEKWFRRWLDELDDHGDFPKRLFDDAVTRFMDEHLPTLKPSSARRYSVSLEWLSDHFAGKYLHEITSASLSEFETARRSAGAAAPTVRRDLACLSSLFTSCEDWEWLPDGRNPVRTFLKKRAKRGLKESPGRKRYLSETEEAALLAACVPPNPPRLSDPRRVKPRRRPYLVKEAIILAIDSGLRQKELFSLTWAQVDLRRRIITTTTDTKSGKSRMVPIAHRSAQLLEALPRHIKSPYVLYDADGNRFVQFNKGFASACRRAGIKDLRWHDLRRTAGCRWLQRDNLSMLEVSMLLGHSSVQVTEKRYAFLNEEKVAADVAQKSHKAGGLL